MSKRPHAAPGRHPGNSRPALLDWMETHSRIMGFWLDRLIDDGRVEEDISDKDIEKEIDKIIKKDLNDALDFRKENDLAVDLQEYAYEHSRLDMTPHEYGVLQRNRYFLAINRFDLIEREGRYYYRDDADRSIENNLFSLPRY